MIEDVQRHCETQDSLACAYFFFDGRDSQRNLQTHDSLIRSIVSQFSSNFAELPVALTELYKKCNNGLQKPSTEALENLLLTIAGNFSHSYIIIDALDECTERAKVLKWIERISSLKDARLRLAVMSRQERDIEEHFKAQRAVGISVADDPANRDIDFYLDEVFRTDEYLSSWDQETRGYIRTSMKNGAQGMYVPRSYHDGDIFRRH